MIGQAVNDRFGRSIALSSDGSLIAIGGVDHRNDTTSETVIGQVKIYEFSSDNGSWIQVGQDMIRSCRW